MQPRILIFRDYYLPGYKSGGPIRSIANLVERLGDEYDFRIVTTDRDEGDEQPFDSVEINAWNRVGKAQVFYLSSESNAWTALHHLLHATEYDLAYLNSLFSYRFTVLPLVLRRVGLVPDIPAVVAPRGELSRYALQLKSAKKRAFLTLAKWFGIYSDVSWHASSSQERDDIRTVFGPQTNPTIAGAPLPHIESAELPEGRAKKTSGTLRVGFLGRVSPIKNIDFAIETLNEVSGLDLSFDIHGPAADPEYFGYCKRLAESGSKELDVTFHGELPHPLVQKTLSKYDVMFLPSKSESFGHAILESLMAACPVLIGQETPWRDLDKKEAGWDIALRDQKRFVELLERLGHMGPRQFEQYQRGARQLAYETIRTDDTPSEYHDLFASNLQ